MKIGFVTQWYPPETGSAALPGVMAQALRKAGHDVTVVTGLPNYPHGELYPGYRRRAYQREVIDGVTVYRAPLYLSHDDNPSRRILNYASFAAAAAPLAPWALRGVDAIWVHSTPATAAAPALFTQALRGTPYVMHIQDLWPETVTASGMLQGHVATLAASLLHRYCDLTYSRAARIGLTAPGMRQALTDRGVPEGKLEDLSNWCDETVFRPLPRDFDLARRMGPFRPFTVMYAGAIGEVQGLDNIIEAATLLQNRPDIGFTLVGDGVARARLERAAGERGLDNVRFIPPQPLKSMSHVLSLADVQLISLRDLPLYRITLPSKVQATLAAGQPMICAAAGNAAAIVERSGAGVAVAPESGEAVAEAVLKAYEIGPSGRREWGRAGREYYDQNLSQRQGVETMVRMLAQAASEEKK